MKRLGLLVLCWLLWGASAAHGQIALDTTPTCTSGIVAISLTWPYTCTACNIIVIGTGAVDASAQAWVGTVACNGGALTKIRRDVEGGGGEVTELWYRIAPDTGTHNCVATWETEAPDLVAAGGITLKNVDQTNPVDAHNGATGAASPASLSVTTVADNAWIIDVVATTIAKTFTPGGTQANPWNCGIGGGSTLGPITPAGATTVSEAWSGWIQWAYSAASFKPAAGGGATKRRVVISD